MILPPLLHRIAIDEKSDSYNQGYDAFWNGTRHIPLKDNPYVPSEGEYDHSAWIYGWLDAKEVDDNILGS